MDDKTLGKQLPGHGSLETGSEKSKSGRAFHARSSGKQGSSGGRIPEVPLTVSVSQQASSAQSLSFEQTYCDLEDILDGAGDASPLTTRAPDDQPHYRNPDSPKPVSAPSDQQQSLGFSTPGFIAAVGSATLAFWFGVFIVISKFQLIEWFFLGSFSMHLRSVYSVTFGESDVPQDFGVIFMVLGWLIWSLAVGMVVISIGQFVNAFAKLLTRREPVGWTDGVNGTLGICAVFLLVAIVFSQISFAKQENLALDVYERPFVEAGEHLDNVSLIRKDIEDRNRSFTISMLAVATVPMTVFGLSMIRLYTKSSHVT